MSQNLFRYFKTSPKFIQLGVMKHASFPLSLRNVGDLLLERGIDHQEVGHHKNNRVENARLPLRRRSCAMLRFRQMQSLQKFASMHSSAHDHFRIGRRINPGAIFKWKREGALRQWRDLAPA